VTRPLAQSHKQALPSTEPETNSLPEKSAQESCGEGINAGFITSVHQRQGAYAAVTCMGFDTLSMINLNPQEKHNIFSSKFLQERAKHADRPNFYHAIIPCRKQDFASWKPLHCQDIPHMPTP